MIIFVGLYLSAIVAANLLVAKFGAGMSVVNAFLFIGLDLTCRDHLHDAWSHHGLVWKMGLLVLAGSGLSWLFNNSAGQIAVASVVSFAAAAVVDTMVYHWLRRHGYLVRVNGSNLVSGLVDSVVFPSLAFGSILPWVILGQFSSKVCGGLLWSLVLRHRRKTNL